MRIPVNITGGTYESRAVQLSSQVTRNWYPEVQDDPNAQAYVLMPWFGYVSFSTDGSGSDRGMLFHRGVLYKVSGITLYSVNSSGSSTSLGTIQGSAQCILQGLGDSVLIANGSGLIYEYDGVTLTQLTDLVFESPEWVAVLKNFAIYGGDADRFLVSAFADASDINALDYARAETAADNLIRGYAFQEELYLFGTTTLEQWFVSGVGRPPVDFKASATIGIASRTAIANNDQYLYWLADDRRVYRVPGLEPVGNVGLANDFENYTTVDDAKAFCCTKQGQNFFHLTFPTENATWAYSEATGQWFNLSSTTTTGRDIANSYAYAYGKHLVADYSSGDIFDWDESTYTENGSEIARERITSPLTADKLGVPGGSIELNRLEIVLEKGQGNLSETNPRLMLQVSTNGGKTYGTERWAPIGKSGEFKNRVIYNNLGRAEEFTFKLKAADNAFFGIRGANIDYEIGL